MTRVEASVLVQASQEDTFDLAQDYALRLDWDPFLRSMEYLDGATAPAPGVRVRVRARNGFSMEVEYVSLDRPHRVAMRMLDGPWFLSRFAGTWRFEQVEATTTRVTFVYSFESRTALLRPLVDRVIRRVFAKDVADRLRGLEHAISQTDILKRLR